LPVTVSLNFTIFGELTREIEFYILRQVSPGETVSLPLLVFASGELCPARYPQSAFPPFRAAIYGDDSDEKEQGYVRFVETVSSPLPRFEDPPAPYS
jgi:hypothetical protein